MQKTIKHIHVEERRKLTHLHNCLLSSLSRILSMLIISWLVCLWVLLSAFQPVLAVSSVDWRITPSHNYLKIFPLPRFRHTWSSSMRNFCKFFLLAVPWHSGRYLGRDGRENHQNSSVFISTSLFRAQGLVWHRTIGGCCLVTKLCLTLLWPQGL